MDAKDQMIQPMEDQLEPPGRIATNLSARNLAVVRNADLVRNVLLGQLLFRLADEADLRNCINPIGIQAGVREDRLIAKRPRRGYSALLHRYRSQRGKADHISHRKD